MKKIIIFLFFSMQIHLLWAQNIQKKTPIPMVMLRVEHVWHVFDTEGKLLWEPSGLRFQSPSGFGNGLFCARQPKNLVQTENDNIEIAWGQVLIDVWGNWAWQPNATFPYRIVAPLDSDSCAVVENLETGERCVFDRNGKQATSFFEDLKYLGKNCIIYADTNTLHSENKIYVIENFIKKTIIAKLKAKDIGDIADGILPFTQDKAGKEKAGYFNISDAKIIIEPIYDLVTVGDNLPFPQSYKNNLVVLKKENQCFIFDRNGKSLFQTPMFEIEALGNSFFKGRLQENDPLFLYQVSEKGVKKVPISGFTEGVDDIGNMTNTNIAYFISKEKCGILNGQGKIIMPLRDYKSALMSETHIFLQLENQQFSVINAQGKTVQQFKANSLAPFVFGKSELEWEGKKSIIKADGTFIAKNIAADEITMFDKFFQTSAKDAQGNFVFNFYNEKGKLVLENAMQRLKADWIIPITNNDFYISY